LCSKGDYGGLPLQGVIERFRARGAGHRPLPRPLFAPWWHRTGPCPADRGPCRLARTKWSSMPLQN